MTTKHEEIKCTQPDCDWKPKSKTHTKQELGRHLKFAHGIAGAFSAATKNQQKRAFAIAMEQARAKKAAIHPEGTTDNVVLKEEAPAKQEKRKYTRRNDIHAEVSSGYKAALNKRRSQEADTLALITVGRITQIIEEVATKHEVSREHFTRRCAELFYASQIR